MLTVTIICHHQCSPIAHLSSLIPSDQPQGKSKSKRRKGNEKALSFNTCTWRRPDYKKLGVLKQQFPDVPIMALTATATKRVCDDLKTMLRLEACESFSASINRPNLLYEVTFPPPSSGLGNNACCCLAMQYMQVMTDSRCAVPFSTSFGCMKLLFLSTAEVFACCITLTRELTVLLKAV